MIRLRPLEQAELTELIRLDTAAHSHPWSEQDLLNAQAASAVSCRVLTLQKRPIGYLVIQRVHDELELQHIVVFRDWQGQGYGRQVLERLLGELADSGARRVFLEVRASNEVARQLYRSVGFVDTAVRRNYYRNDEAREDAVLMQLDLSGPAAGGTSDQDFG